jgi:hypothetical protein
VANATIDFAFFKAKSMLSSILSVSKPGKVCCAVEKRVEDG